MPPACRGTSERTPEAAAADWFHFRRQGRPEKPIHYRKNRWTLPAPCHNQPWNPTRRVLCLLRPCASPSSFSSSLSSSLPHSMSGSTTTFPTCQKGTDPWDYGPLPVRTNVLCWGRVLTWHGHGRSQRAPSFSSSFSSGHSSPPSWGGQHLHHGGQLLPAFCALSSAQVGQVLQGRVLGSDHRETRLIKF